MDFADEFREPNQSIIDPALFAKGLHLHLQELATLAGVHRAIVSAMPTNSRLQSYLREAVRTLSSALEVTHDRHRSIYWFRNTPIPEFDYHTAERLVAAGKTDAVIAYVASIASGSTG
jgi:hypothetical protein